MLYFWCNPYHVLLSFCHFYRTQMNSSHAPNLNSSRCIRNGVLWHALPLVLRQKAPKMRRHNEILRIFLSGFVCGEYRAHKRTRVTSALVESEPSTEAEAQKLTVSVAVRGTATFRFYLTSPVAAAATAAATAAVASSLSLPLSFSSPRVRTARTKFADWMAWVLTRRSHRHRQSHRYGHRRVAQQPKQIGVNQQ